MPNINLRDPRNRDAVVSAEPVSPTATVRYVDANGAAVKLQHVLKSTSEHTLERLLKKAGGEEHIVQHLISDDADTDIERIGMFLKGAHRVYVNDASETVFRIQQTEIIRGPFGEEKERRPRKQQLPNIETEFPINWTGRLVKKDDAIRRFVFSSKLQIIHINGLTYDFLYSMAKELAKYKIRSNCVAPGWTETDMATDKINEFGREQIIKSIPLGRIGLPEDSANAAIYLLSDLAQFITGSTITVDGGFDMRG